ncbi:MAG: ABC transporter ATP-binding protein [Acaryochloridaceae cyanobacterium RU_4_10]|nr:ABC transporter ATP-binding protein [Acaryochloridaceae cyanobacterium RU_4_10]
MSDTIISAENIGKKYIVGHQQQQYVALRDVVAHSVKTLSHRLNPYKPHSSLSTANTTFKEEFWALKNVSFEIKQGDRVGIIGRNGAGKSTLLKILSRITEPTTGRVNLKGRVASLLEVGTGFHPELTGRENIYLNGAILGMGKVEIHHKFDEIAAFAEVEKFLDTPVKRYSSGMYVRLAFSVAAHLEPEILVVDEVLAVGDVQFQKKCLGKMEDVAENEGRTVLFVSHNMAAIKRLCSQGILLQQGKLLINDNIDNVIQNYLAKSISIDRVITWEINDAPKTSEMILREIRILDDQRRVSSTLSTADSIIVEIEYDLLIPIRGLRIVIGLLTQDGVTVFSSSDLFNAPDSARLAGKHISRCTIPGNLLNIGSYILSLYVDIPKIKILFNTQEYLSFTISELANNPMGIGAGTPKGIINPQLNWEILNL